MGNVVLGNQPGLTAPNQQLATPPFSVALPQRLAKSRMKRKNRQLEGNADSLFLLLMKLQQNVILQLPERYPEGRRLCFQHGNTPLSRETGTLILWYQIWCCEIHSSIKVTSVGLSSACRCGPTCRRKDLFSGCDAHQQTGCVSGWPLAAAWGGDNYRVFSTRSVWGG